MSLQGRCLKIAVYKPMHRVIQEMCDGEGAEEQELRHGGSGSTLEKIRMKYECSRRFEYLWGERSNDDLG